MINFIEDVLIAAATKIEPRLILKHNFNANGHRTAKMTISKKEDMFHVWINLGEKGAMIRLNKENAEKLIAFLKNNV